MDNKIKIWWFDRVVLVIGIFAVIGLFVWMSLPDSEHIDQPVYVKETRIAKVVVDGTFTVERLKKEIDTMDIKYPEIVLAQAKLETGNFKSQLFKKNNNLFGFRGKNGYIKYNHWKESVKDYKRFQVDSYRSGDYYYFLEAIGYAEDTNYIKKVKSCVE